MKTVLITGASDGIGAVAAAQLAESGHRVLIAGRSAGKTRAVAEATGATPFIADFAQLDDVRRLADEVLAELDGAPLDVLANNAGGLFGDPAKTVDGHEKTFQINHLAPFLLTHLLLDRLKAAEGGKASVINTSSIANRLGHIDLHDLDNDRKFSANKAYGDAKLANILFTRGLHARYHASGISTVAFHPGAVATNFASESNSIMRIAYQSPLRKLFLISSEKGGSNLTWFVEGSPEVAWRSGNYYDQVTPTAKVNPQALDRALIDGLWNRSAELVGITP